MEVLYAMSPMLPLSLNTLELTVKDRFKSRTQMDGPKQYSTYPKGFYSKSIRAPFQDSHARLEG